MGPALAVARYRLRATFARRWTGYLSVAILIGLLGGVAMASIAGARRTQSSYPTYVASTDPSTLSYSVYNGEGQSPASLTSKIKALPDVARVRTLDALTVVPLTAAGAPRLGTLNLAVTLGSTDGYLIDQDRLSIVKGRRFDPSSKTQVVLTASAEKIWGVHVGETVTLGMYSPSQENETYFGTPKVPPRKTIRATVVGTGVINSELVQDDIDRAYGFAFLTPALAREAISVDPLSARPAYYAIQLRRGASLKVAERQLTRLLPAGDTYNFHVTARTIATVELAIKPETLALGAFGVVAALVCLILAAQALARQLRRGGTERGVLRALGATSSATFFDGYLAVAGAVLAGAVLAALIAVGLSPLTPIGPVRPVYPDPGLSADWTVLGLGALVILAGLGGFAALTAYRLSPARTSPGAADLAPRLNLIRRSQSLGLSIAAAVGVYFALETEKGHREVPVRSILLGVSLAVTLLVATLTFSSSLEKLVSTPSLYGWNWSYAVVPSSEIPPSMLPALAHDPDVAGVTGATYTNLEIDGVNVPVLFEPTSGKVIPPILSGHRPRSGDEVVLGAATLAVLHKSVGQYVTVTDGAPKSAPVYIPPTRVLIVGTATLPAIGYATVVADHTAMGTGALLADSIIPPAMRRALQSPDKNLDGPDLAFVRLKSTVPAAAGLASLRAVVRAANRLLAKDPHAQGATVGLLGPQRPAQIVNYRTIGNTPLLLAAGVAAGAVAALAMTLVASVRRRRRDLALLKTLGFTRRQLAIAVSWQATIDGLVGAVIGVPLGILLGRELWDLFARSINAVPHPAVPALAVVLVALGTLVVANLAAALPGRSAAATEPGLVLRSE